MAPKKKGNKKGDDDWEAELGESIAPADAQPADGTNGDDAAAEGEEDGENAGGLMAMLKKRKERRKQKGLPEEEGAETVGEPQLATAQEANADDEFALPEKKGKGGKGKQQNQKKAADDDRGDGTGKVLTKAEKEKLKKEREKQRKKEQVCCHLSPRLLSSLEKGAKTPNRLRKRRLSQRSPNLRSLSLKRNHPHRHPHPPLRLKLAVRRRRFLHTWLRFRNNRRSSV